MKIIRILILKWLKKQYARKVDINKFDLQLSQVLDCLEYILDYEKTRI